MNRQSNFSPQWLQVLLLGVATVALSACGDSGPTEPVRPQLQSPTTSPYVDAAQTSDQRIQSMLAAKTVGEGSSAAILGLIRAMKHRSQCAFLIEPSKDHALGLHTVEFKSDGIDTYPVERITAVLALEKSGSYIALPDLALALSDIHPVLRNHAARALVKLGNREGVPVLLDGLKEKVFGNETAVAILREISGKRFGFNPDGGQHAKAEAEKRWRKWWDEHKASGTSLIGEGTPYQMGQEPEADRRLAFFTAMLGQYQFLFHEQARLALQRVGAPALPFLRVAVESARKQAGGGSVQTRAGAAQVLAKIDTANARELLTDLLLKDKDPTVRLRAALSFAELGGDDAVGALGSALGDQASVVLSALAALGRIGGDKALKTLRDANFGEPKDAAVEFGRTLALFEATQCQQGKARLLDLLVSGTVAERNQVHEVLVRVLGKSLDYDPVGPTALRAQVRDQYVRLLAQ